MKSHIARQAFTEVENSLNQIECELLVNDFQAAASKAYQLIKSAQKLKQILERNENTELPISI